MSTALISFRNYADDGTLSEGATGSEWLSSLPLSNLQTPLKSEKARTDSDLSVDFDIDLGRSKTISFVSLLGHNLTSTGTWRVRISNQSDFSTLLYDSGDVDIWPVTEIFGENPWGGFVWNGKNITDDGNFGFLLLDSSVYGRYVRINLDDSDNEDGYLEAGRLIIDSPWRPSKSFIYGAELTYINPSEKERSRGGQPWTDRLPQYRKATFEIRNLGEDEMFGQGYEMDRLLGIAKHCFIMLDPSNITHRHRWAFYGTIKEINPQVFDTYNKFSKQFEIEESL